MTEKDVFKNYSEFITQVSKDVSDKTPKFIIGQSIGALYAFRLCQMDPDLFKAAVLINPLLEFS